MGKVYLNGQMVGNILVFGKMEDSMVEGNTLQIMDACSLGNGMRASGLGGLIWMLRKTQLYKC